ncbi:hypothetical protein [Cohnella abietis]|uniref:Uncharacterized protein n=1 Tax=Cohnella abietis TaxID=2507935 RepID=A0A3T1DEN4_9BACL|nr:hypothetical protein [Cohnella abietis]BBI36559.1 hypothetical protein KCTCHS21_59580 [Cohnella abietis]
MNSLSNPDWYDALKDDQPLRTRTFTEELATDIYTKALASPARKTFFFHKRRILGAAIIAVAACMVFLFTNTLESNVAPASPPKIGSEAGPLDPQIRDTLINSRLIREGKKEILLEKRINGNHVLIYSAPPASAESASLIIDILKWTDYGDDHSVGTGLDGWSQAYSGQGEDKASMMPGVTWGGEIGYGDLKLFNGNITESNISGIRVVDGSGKQWDAHIFPSSDGSRYWFVDIAELVKNYKIEALDAQGAVLSSFSPNF